jgi:CheY-like chemotaxis protein
MRLLLVEDHEDCLMMMSMLLEMLGHQVTPARSIAAALEAASGSTFDCVISDLGLPDGSGHQLMRALKEGSAIRGIALSGSVGDEDVRESMRAGFQKHLAKPVEATELEAALAALST